MVTGKTLESAIPFRPQFHFSRIPDPIFYGRDYLKISPPYFSVHPDRKIAPARPADKKSG
jgi:hypothetical protein